MQQSSCYANAYAATLPSRLSTDTSLLLTAKVSWIGCGLHVPRVMDIIPENERCTCGPKVEKEGKMYPPGTMRPRRTKVVEKPVEIAYQE